MLRLLRSRPVGRGVGPLRSCDCQDASSTRSYHRSAPRRSISAQRFVHHVGGARGDDRAAHGRSLRPPLTRALRDAALGSGAASSEARAEQPSNASLQEEVARFGELSFLFRLCSWLGAMATFVLQGRVVRSERPQIATGVDFGMQIRSSTLVLSAAAILVVWGLAPWATARAVARLDIAKVVRERPQEPARGRCQHYC